MGHGVLPGVGTGAGTNLAGDERARPRATFSGKMPFGLAAGKADELNVSAETFLLRHASLTATPGDLP